MIRTYEIQMGWGVLNNVHEFMTVRKECLKITQVFWYASGIDLNYAEYWIKKSPILVFLN